MAEPKTGELMEKIVSLCKRRGFIFQSSEIYGGLNGFWDYGPLGAELKRNIKECWWRSMTQLREDVVGLDASIIMHPRIWEASGHTSTFSDLMVDCLLTKKRFRADQIEPQSGTAYFIRGASDGNGGKECKDAFSVLIATGKHAEYARKVARQFYQERGLENPALAGERTEEVKNTTRYNPENGGLLTEPRPFNLMLKTYVGPVESADNISYLRPETAQAIFVQFKNTLEVSRQRVPFGDLPDRQGVPQRDQPAQFHVSLARVRADGAGVLHPPGRGGAEDGRLGGKPVRPSTLNAQPAAELGVGALAQVLGRAARQMVREHWAGARHAGRILAEERGAGALRQGLTVDILFKFPFGTQELEGIAARGDFDLTQHQKFSGKSMEYFDEEAKAKYVPHVIEPSAGVDRLALALICNAYCEDQAPDEKGKLESRVVMKFHPRIAPIKVAVFPLLKNKPELVKKAKAVRELLRPHMSVFYDEAGAIGRRYRRQDEAGTPFGVTIDFETLGEQGPALQDTVTLRDRDTMKQERVKIGELVSILLEKIR